MARLVVYDAMNEGVVPFTDDLVQLVEAVDAQIAPVLQGSEPLVQGRFTLVVIFRDHVNLFPFFLLMLCVERRRRWKQQ